jgi:hypothetical protein
MKPITITRVLATVLMCLASSVCFGLLAGDPTATPADSATGTWVFTLRVEDLTIDSVAELKQAGQKITGTVIAGVAKKPSEITNGKISGHDIQFTVDRVEETGTFETKYTGKLEGDQIRGKVESGWLLPDHPQRTTVNWVAKRVKGGSTPSHGVR